MMSTIEHHAVFHAVWQYHVETVPTTIKPLLSASQDAAIVEHHCNVLGLHGWELVGVAPVTNANGATRELRLFFKRRVDGP